MRRHDEPPHLFIFCHVLLTPLRKDRCRFSLITTRFTLIIIDDATPRFILFADIFWLARLRYRRLRLIWDYFVSPMPRFISHFSSLFTGIVFAPFFATPPSFIFFAGCHCSARAAPIRHCLRRAAFHYVYISEIFISDICFLLRVCITDCRAFLFLAGFFFFFFSTLILRCLPRSLFMPSTLRAYADGHLFHGDLSAYGAMPLYHVCRCFVSLLFAEPYHTPYRSLLYITIYLIVHRYYLFHIFHIFISYLFSTTFELDRFTHMFHGFPSSFVLWLSFCYTPRHDISSHYLRLFTSYHLSLMSSRQLFDVYFTPQQRLSSIAFASLRRWYCRFMPPFAAAAAFFIMLLPIVSDICCRLIICAVMPPRLYFAAATPPRYHAVRHALLFCRCRRCQPPPLFWCRWYFARGWFFAAPFAPL